MTEQEFQKQNWRMYDRITTADGVQGKVIGVSFTTKSVRALISGAPEWLHCDLIETHTTAKGGTCDDATIIEELHNRVLGHESRIEKLIAENAELREQASKKFAGSILTQINIIANSLLEKKKRIERIDTAIETIKQLVEKIDKD